MRHNGYVDRYRHRPRAPAQPLRRGRPPRGRRFLRHARRASRSAAAARTPSPSASTSTRTCAPPRPERPRACSSSCPTARPGSSRPTGSKSAIEESILLSDTRGNRKTEQIVIYGRVQQTPRRSPGRCTAPPSAAAASAIAAGAEQRPHAAPHLNGRIATSSDFSGRAAESCYRGAALNLSSGDSMAVHPAASRLPTSCRFAAPCSPSSTRPASSTSPARSPAAASRSSRPAAPARRSPPPASPVARRLRRHRLSRDHGRARQDAAPGDPWRPPRRPRRSRPRRGDGRRTASPAIDLLVVNLYPFEETVAAGADYAHRGREHRHRRPGNDPRRRQEPRLCRGRRRSGRLCRRSSPRSPSMTAPRPFALRRRARRQGLRPHRRLRRGDLRLVRRDGRRADARPGGASPAVSAETLRYGENPHQSAALYLTGERRPGVATARQVQGKELSYNNLNDTDAAYELVAEFDPGASAAVAIIKHANPCGVAEAPTLAEAYRKALRCDPGLRLRRHHRAQPPARCRGRRRDRQDLHRGHHRARRQRRGEGDPRRRRRTSACSSPAACPIRARAGLTVRTVAGGLLVQDRDAGMIGEADLKVVTKRAPTRGRDRRSPLRLARRQARQVERHRLCQGRRHRRHRRRPDEPGRFGHDRRPQGCGSRPRPPACRSRSPKARWSPRTPSSPSPTG